jgi:molybdenum cofactor cytidylyltransferase
LLRAPPCDGILFPMSRPHEHLCGILLAAGRGLRFDPNGAQNKLLQTLPGGECVVVASARNMLGALAKVVAVTRPGDLKVAQALRAAGCEVVECPDADTGMAASLRYAVRHAFAAHGWLIGLGDMPHVHSATMANLCAAIEQGASIAAPTFEGQRGNPVAFGREHLSRLLALDGDQGARGILKTYPVVEIAGADSGILQDIDTRADLR